MRSYRELFQEGLLDICQFLEVEMKDFLIMEGRFRFRVERYWKTLMEQTISMNNNVSKDDIDSYGRILYLIRKSIYSEYSYLRQRRLSPADSAITILHKILEYSEILGEFRFSQEQRKKKKIIDALWENIRHPAKESQLKKLKKSIITAIENELRGTLCLNELSLLNVENPKPKKQKLKEETKFYNESKTKEIKL